MKMKAYSTGSGAVMFVPDTIARKEIKDTAIAAKEKNTLLDKRPLSYKSLAASPEPVHVPQSDIADDVQQQAQVL